MSLTWQRACIVCTILDSIHQHHINRAWWYKSVIPDLRRRGRKRGRGRRMKRRRRRKRGGRRIRHLGSS